MPQIDELVMPVGYVLASVVVSNSVPKADLRGSLANKSTLSGADVRRPVSFVLLGDNKSNALKLLTVVSSAIAALSRVW
jgi:hypothetical protein